MRYGLNSLEGLIEGDIWETTIGGIKGGTGCFDNSSHARLQIIQATSSSSRLRSPKEIISEVHYQSQSHLL